MIIDQREKCHISNDGATILQLLDIVHPAAKTLVDIAKSQDAEIGDGTTSGIMFTISSITYDENLSLRFSAKFSIFSTFLELF